MNLFRELTITKTEFLAGVFGFLIFSILVFGSRQARQNSDNAIIIDEGVNLILDETYGLQELIDKMTGMKVEFSESELTWAARLLGWRSFKRGNYFLEGDYSYEVFLSKLALGIQDPVAVVVLPGITQQRFSASVATGLNFDSVQVESVFSDRSFLAEIALSKEELLGRMLPDTYLMYWTSTPKEVVRRILREFKINVTDIYADTVESMGRSFDEVLVMASIVEWEAKLEAEKATIAGLYWNRIERRMRLEADPTVNFALGERRRLLFEDYRFDHPFNTYMKRGLPPGPITNPGLNTIKATIFPESHDYLYMVANPEGGHVFSRTFEEHQQASDKWRRWLREQYRIARQRELNNR